MYPNCILISIIIFFTLSCAYDILFGSELSSNGNFKMGTTQDQCHECTCDQIKIYSKQIEVRSPWQLIYFDFWFEDSWFDVKECNRRTWTESRSRLLTKSLPLKSCVCDINFVWYTGSKNNPLRVNTTLIKEMFSREGR